MVSTAQDWSRFYTALMSGKLLPAAQLAQLGTTVPIFPDQPDGPGYGLGIQTAPPRAARSGVTTALSPATSTNVTDRTGSRTATVLIAAESWAEFGADPEIAAAGQGTPDRGDLHHAGPAGTDTRRLTFPAGCGAFTVVGA
jgi:D-alanyl-D-alanine carboxypeptidase